MKKDTSRTGAQLLASVLAAHGCKRAFGIPGGEVLAIIDALANEGIEFILTKHENSAGFMAEGAWHADGLPPVLIATIGPGVANAINTIANAHQDKVPLIFISGCVDAEEAKSYTHQIFDHGAMLAPVVKKSFMTNAENIHRICDEAVKLALSPQFGPVHLDVPVTVAENPAVSSGLMDTIIDPVKNTVTEPHLEDCAKILSEAENPVAIAGVDAVNELAGQATADFCRKFKIPLVTTYKAKGLLDEADPLALGGAGLSPKADNIVLPLIAKADTVLLIGYDPIEMRIGWRNPWSENAKVVEITPVERSHGMHTVTHTIQSTVEDGLQALSAKMVVQRNKLPDTISQTRNTLREAFSPTSKFGPDRVFQTLREVMPDNTVATADSGAHRILLSQMWRCPSPRTLLQSSALCTMACALPIAAGYKFAKPETPVVAFVGDAGIEMGLGELATLREHGIPIIITILVDESLTLIEMKQRASQRPNLGVDFSGSDFPAIAAAMGGYGVWIDDSETLASEASKALNRDCFTLLACRIGRKAYDGKI